MKTKTSCGVHPMLMFWIGVLTGAVIVALTFLYRLYALDAQTNTFYRTLSTTPTSSVMINDPNPWIPTFFSAMFR